MSYFPEIANDGLRLIIAKISNSRKEIEIRIVSDKISQYENFSFRLGGEPVSPATVKVVAISWGVTEVILPLLSTTNWGIELVLPYVPEVTPEVVNIWVDTFSVSLVDTRNPPVIGSVNVESETSVAGLCNLI